MSTPLLRSNGPGYEARDAYTLASRTVEAAHDAVAAAKAALRDAEIVSLHAEAMVALLRPLAAREHEGLAMGSARRRR